MILTRAIWANQKKNSQMEVTSKVLIQKVLEAMEEMHEGVEHLLDSDDQAAPCDCMPGCGQIKYHYHHSSSPYSPPHSQDNGSIAYSKLVVFFEEATLMTMKRKELYGVTDFIASCGGLLGLFTGFSVITFAELLYFATLRLVCCLRYRHPLSVATSKKPAAFVP